MNINRSQIATVKLKQFTPSVDQNNFEDGQNGLAAGFPPYTRGLHSAMYATKPWTIRQYSGYSTAEKSNAFYKKNLAAGQKGLSVAFDLPTHRGYDSNHMLAQADVGKSGVAIDSVEDMKILFKDIPLEKMSVSMTMNGAVLPIMAFYIVAAEEQGVPSKNLKGTIQNDILKEFLVRNTYIYPPASSLEIVTHIFKYTAEHMPKFNSISISGYHMQEAGATAAQELAFTIANGLEYVKLGLKSGLDIDDFAPRLSFFWGVGMDFFTEISKLRAARAIWAELMQGFNPKNKKSLMLRAHCQTSGWSLTAQDPYNNISRTSIEAMAAVLGGTQSLHTNSLDEAIALPTDYSAKIARNTQIHLQKETDLCAVVDPFAGSHEVESKTKKLILEVSEILKEINLDGGMEQLISDGTIKTKIEKAATIKQAQIDSGKEIIVGVNSFRNEEDLEIDVLSVDNVQVLQSQKKKIQLLKETRNEKSVIRALETLTAAAISSVGDEMSYQKNLLEATIDCARKRATLGEISEALVNVYGRHQAKHNIFSAVYSQAIKQDKQFTMAKEKVSYFLKKTGRRPRILLAKVGQDGHDRGINIVATALADLGFDVDLGPLFQTAEMVVKQAIENDVHIIGISSMSGGQLGITKELNEALKNAEISDIKIVLGGIIPKKEETVLRELGASAFFGPGTPIHEIASDLIELLISEN